LGPGGARRPFRRGHRRRQRRGLSAGQGGRRSAAVPRGAGALRPDRARRPQPLRLLPHVLVPAAGRRPHRDAHPHPGRPRRPAPPPPPPPPPSPAPPALLHPPPAPPHPAPPSADSPPPPSSLGDLGAFEQMPHNRLFGLPPVEPSVFHRTGT